MIMKVFGSVLRLVGFTSGNGVEVTAANEMKVDASGTTLSSTITDEYGFELELTPTNELRAVEPVRLVGTGFGAAKNVLLWTETVANGGTVTQTDEIVTLATNTTANGSAQYVTNHRARYIAGSANRFRSNLSLGDTGEVDNSRKWGAFNGTDGCYFELDGTTVYVVTLKSGVATRVASSSWNASTTVPTLTNNNVYEIYYTNDEVYFSINGTLKHTVYANSTHWTAKMTLMAELRNTNSNGLATNHTMICRSASIYRLGRLQTSSVYGRITTAATRVFKSGPGRLHTITLNDPDGTLITVYDNTSGTGTTIAVIDAPAQANPVTLHYNVNFEVGLTVVSTGTWDATIVYE